MALKQRVLFAVSPRPNLYFQGPRQTFSLNASNAPLGDVGDDAASPSEILSDSAVALAVAAAVAEVDLIHGAFSDWLAKVGL